MSITINNTQARDAERARRIIHLFMRRAVASIEEQMTKDIEQAYANAKAGVRDAAVKAAMGLEPELHEIMDRGFTGELKLALLVKDPAGGRPTQVHP